MNTLKINKGNTKLIAHRGVSGLETENTNLAFVAAGSRSYFGVETDIHRTADGNFVFFHDDTTKRLSGVDLNVEETDYSTLRSLKLFDIDGSSTREDIRVSSLEEYIGICKKYEKVCVLELKNHMEERDVRTIIDRIELMEYLNKVIFISFDFDNLVYVRNYRPGQSVQYLMGRCNEELLARLIKHGFDVDVYAKVLTKEAVDLYHRSGMRVNCWTVDTVEDAERLVGWGVDYITTNILE